MRRHREVAFYPGGEGRRNDEDGERGEDHSNQSDVGRKKKNERRVLLAPSGKLQDAQHSGVSHD